MKGRAPTAMGTRAAEAQGDLQKWVHRWEWRYRRASCADMFLELGSAARLARERGCMW